MTNHRGTETEFELTTIERLELLGYRYVNGEDLERPHDEVVLREPLRANLKTRYPTLSDSSLELAVATIAAPEGADTLRRNQTFHEMVRGGFELSVELPNGRKEHRHIYPIDWEDPNANEFLVVNQFPIKGPQNDRRPDIIIFVNGLPLVLFELKNPYSEKPTVDDAFNQVQHYRNDIPQVFDYNAVCVVSDGITSLHGMWSSTFEWYAPWNSIDGQTIEATTTGSMKMLVEGLLPRDRLLQYVRDFIVFEVANDVITKKGAKYHQFFAVQLVVEKTLDTLTNGGDKRIGVVWHTTGAGKSLSMLFLVGILKRHPDLKNPAFLIQVDSDDIDNQLHDQFVAARALVGDVKHARSVDHLRELLQTEGGETIFSLIQKFRLKDGETQHPVLSERSNIIIIADEAHRTQYGFEAGFARYLADALPNAKRIGFTGTPVTFGAADTYQVFGDEIHAYDMEQSKDDKATVPLYYAARQVKLHLGREDIDSALSDVTEGETVDERKKSRWAALAAAAGTRERLSDLAKDLLAHFKDRTETLAGKAMIVCMTRENCVRLYDALTALPGSPEVKVVMTGNLSTDPPAWSEAGHLTTKAERDAIKQRMIDPNDALKIVIVCDMWLAGTDIPCLHTLYVDKPMRGHTVIQAISRVNRVFRDKPHGLIVDYIGIADELRQATAKYTSGGGRGEPVASIDDTAKPLFYECLDAVRGLVPEGNNYGDWRGLSRIGLEDLYALVYGHLTEDDELRDDFLKAELRLHHAFLLVKHIDECREHADEVVFYQRTRKQISKTLPGRATEKTLDRAVRDLVDDSVESEGVVDIFSTAGIETPDISILDENFLQTYKDRPQENLRVKLLERILDDAISLRRNKNLAKARSFKEMLEDTLRKYHNRLIDAAAVIEALIKIRKEMETDDKRADELGLSLEELAFYDAVSENASTIYDQRFLCELIHDVVRTIKRNLKVDWTKSHREDVKAEVRAAVRRVLRKREIRTEDFDPFLQKFLEQAEALFANWPIAA